MIDIHTHILPDVDDGSRSFEDSLMMAEQASSTGTTYMVATPHCNIPGMYQNYKSRYLVELFNTLKREISRAEIPLKLLAGMEIYATPDLPKLLQEDRVWRLNQSHYFLTEFAFDEDPHFCDQILEKCAGLGLTPVVAHPERYYSVQDNPDIVLNWYKKGYGIQVNKGSILGRFGPNEEACAHFLLRRRTVTCIASDAHRPNVRTTPLDETYALVERLYGEKPAQVYLQTNPARILSDKKMLRFRPLIDEEGPLN